VLQILRVALGKCTSLPNATCTNITNVIYYILASFKDLPEDFTVVPKHFGVIKGYTRVAKAKLKGP